MASIMFIAHPRVAMNQFQHTEIIFAITLRILHPLKLSWLNINE
ncbi:hypothetical protein CSC33_6181 [Pseudomonas aeruginosa]|nr:hypothetical protein CSC33_6181 [Pseudomonas aeruginosa]